MSPSTRFRYIVLNVFCWRSLHVQRAKHRLFEDRHTSIAFLSSSQPFHRRRAGQTPPEHLAALQVCQADLRAAVNDILREAQPHMLQQLLPPDGLQPPAMAAAQLLAAPNGQQQARPDALLPCSRH